MTHAVTLKIGAECEDILRHLYNMGQEFHNVKHKYPKRTEANRRTLKPYMFKSMSRGDEQWQAWAYHTTKGVTVCATKLIRY